MTRKNHLALAAALAALLTSQAAFAVDKVKIAIIGGTADIGFYLGVEKGWFAEAGIEVEMIPFDSGARMIAPMSTGEIDVGTGAVSAGLYNAFDREITMRIVGDKGRNVKGMSFQGLMLRKALADSGAVKTTADLKGRKVAFTGPGATDSVTLDDALKPSGSSFNDVEAVYLGLAAQLAAYSNGAIDASVMPEPFRSTAISKGLAVELKPVGEIRDNHQTGAVVYSQVFIKNRPDVAQRLMNAYIKGVRYYNDTLKDGKISGPHAAEIIDATAKHSTLKDKDVLRAIVPVAIDPDGMLGIDSLKADLAFYKAQGLVKSAITVDDLVDLSFVKKAVATLGPYKKN